MGPIMFIIYINDLPEFLEHSRTLMYADDTVLYCGDVCNCRVRKLFQSDLNNVERWCLANRLSLNVSKTKNMTFMSEYKRKKSVKFRLYMRGRLIDEVETYKYLGTHIDNKLKERFNTQKQHK